jgi:fatty acid desaturase
MHIHAAAIKRLLALPHIAPLCLLLSGIAGLAGILFSNLFASAFSKHLMSKQLEQGTYRHFSLTETIQSSTHRRNPLYMVFINMHAVNLQLILLALAAIFGTVDVFLIFIGTYYTVRFLVFFFGYYHKARVELS